MNAFSRLFPNATIKGCFFHFSNAIFRRIQQVGLKTDYQENHDLQLRLKMIAAIAFVPLHDVSRAFDQLQMHVINWAQQQNFQHPAAIANIQNVLTFFEETYCINPSYETPHHLGLGWVKIIFSTMLIE